MTSPGHTVEPVLTPSIPADLYIPPHALRVFLATFEGPLDLLLYLIRKQNIDILNIPVAKITEQYMAYIERMQALQISLAGEYLFMAGQLTEIKSLLLLPKRDTFLEETTETDPRAELVRRLQIYEHFKRAAQKLDALPRLGRDTALVSVALPAIDIQKPQPDIAPQQLCQAMQGLLKRRLLTAHHTVVTEPISIKHRMENLLLRLSPTQFLPLRKLLVFQEGRSGLVVTFIAILELVKQSFVHVVQNQPFSPIHIKLIEGGAPDGR